MPKSMRRKLIHPDRQVLTDDNPARFLFVLFSMRARADRADIYWDHEDLEWCAKVWALAAIAGSGPFDKRSGEEFRKWAEFYQHHCDELKNGEAALGTMGYRWFDRDDEWPRASVIGRAILALRHADMAAPGVVPKPSLHRGTQ